MNRTTCQFTGAVLLILIATLPGCGESDRPDPRPPEATRKWAEAAVSGDRSRMAELIEERGIDLETVIPIEEDEDSHLREFATALLLAASAGNLECAKYLLDQGADVQAVDGKGEAALSLASRDNDVPMIEILMSSGADIEALDAYGHTALSKAARGGHLDAVVALLKAGADPNVRDRDGVYPIMWAILRGYSEMMDLLIDNGAEVAQTDVHGDEALFVWACGHANDVDSIRRLVKEGIDPNLQSPDGFTGLMRAAFQDRPDLTQYLLDLGADPNVRSVGERRSGWTALYYGLTCPAAVEIVGKLLAAGADVSVQDNEGRSPLVVAAARAVDADVLLLLIAAGASLDEQNSRGQSVLEILQNRGSIGESILSRIQAEQQGDEGE